MKKIICCFLCVILVCVACISVGCAEMYKLTVKDSSNCLIAPIRKFYKAGQTVTVKTKIVIDAMVIVLLNDEQLSPEIVGEDDRHYEFTFVMPDCDSTLIIKIG